MVKMSQKFLVGLVALSFTLSVASAAEETVTAKAPSKPWSISADYQVSRSLQTVKAEPAKALANLGAKWSFSPSFQAGVGVSLANTFGDPKGANLTVTDPSLTATAPNIARVAGLDITASNKIFLGTSKASRDDASRLYASGAFVLSTSKVLGAWNLGGKLTTGWFAHKYKTLITSDGEVPAPIGGLREDITASTKLGRFELGTGIGVAQSLAYNSNVKHKVEVMPSVTVSPLENLSLSFGTVSTFNIVPGKPVTTSLELTPSVEWAPITNMKLSLGVECGCPNYVLTSLKEAVNYKPSLALSYVF